MRLPMRVRELAPRLATGAYILNAGLEKSRADEDRAKQLHSMAGGTYPFLKQLEPTRFVRLLSTGEIALGVTLLTPLVPAAVAGAALTAFSGGLLGMYLRTPGMHKPGSLAPTPAGLAISKDVWMLGIGLGLLSDAITRRDHESDGD